MATKSEVGWLGPSHWKLTINADGDCSIQPRDHTYVVGLALLMAFVWLAVLWWSSAPLQLKTFMTLLGVVAMTVIVAVLLTVNRVEMRRGPYFKLSESVICLRGKCIDVNEFASFEVREKNEFTGDGNAMYYLVLKDNLEDESIVIKSTYASELRNLKKTLDNEVVPVILARSGR